MPAAGAGFGGGEEGGGGGGCGRYLYLVERVQQRVLLAELQDDLNDTARAVGTVCEMPSPTRKSSNVVRGHVAEVSAYSVASISSDMLKACSGSHHSALKERSRQ